MKKSQHKISIRSNEEPAITVFRTRPKAKRVAYILTANKPVKLKCSKGKSRIIYIGESGKKGLGRPATSAYRKADDAFGTKGKLKKHHGVTRIDVHLLTFQGKQRTKVWKILERDLIATFKDMHNGGLPFYNEKGKGKGYSTDEIKLFSMTRLRNVIESISFWRPTTSD